MAVGVKARVVALGVVLFGLAGCGGSGGPSDVAPTSTPTSAASAVQHQAGVVLGSVDFFPSEFDRGFGSPHPRRIHNGGAPSGGAFKIDWSGWGKATATANAKGRWYKPHGGYYAKPVDVQLRATDLGPGCDGQRGYHQLRVRRQTSPGSGQWTHWKPWWHGRDLCKSA